MLASRLLSILMRLQARGRMSASQLAVEFEVAVRTIHRDIDQLSAAGIPVYADRGRAGGFRLHEGYRTTLTGLTQAEAETLFLAGLPGPAAQLGLAESLSAARLKLMAALPATMQPGVERVAARFHLDVTAWFRDADQLPALPVVAKAVWSEYKLNVRYRRAGQTTASPRKLSPLGLVLKGGVWYLVAHSGKSIRTYRVANINDAEISEEAFTRPKEFDLPKYWEKASRAYEAGVYRERAEVRLSPKGINLLELLGPYVMRAAAQTASKPDRNGWVRCTLPLESFEFGVRELMRLGEEVNVIGPRALREQMAQTANRIAKNHARAFSKRKRRRRTVVALADAANSDSQPR